MPEYNCKKCTSMDNERMVQCDACDNWFHFECVNVSSDIANISWICDLCGNRLAVSITTPTLGVKSGTKEPHVQVARTTVATATMTTSNTIVSNAPPNTLCTLSNHHRNNVITWSNTHLQCNSSSMVQEPGPSSYPRGNTDQRQANEYTPEQRELKLRMLEEERELQKRYLEKKYEILSQCGENSPLGSGHTMGISLSQPTSLQLAARQVIPRDLPTFDGNPEDWPLFFSSFKNSTEIAGYSDAENLIRLQSCLRGKAKDLVRSKLLLPSMVSEIIQTLQMCYGRPEYILDSLIEKARKFPPPRDRLEGFIEYALMVRNLCSTMEASSMGAHLNNPMLVKELLEKLPNSQKLNWAMHPKNDQIPIIKIFSDWMYNIAMAASQVVSPTVNKRQTSLNLHLAETEHQAKKLVCAMCNESHKIQNCETFKKATLEEKWSVVKSKRLCRQCLNFHRRQCFFNRVCGIDNCSAKHHQLLHKRNNTSQSEDMVPSNENLVNAHNNTNNYINLLFRFIPIRLYGKSKILETFAFLDEGSSVTLIEHDLFEELNVEGTKESLTLQWTGQITRDEDSSMRFSVLVSGIENKKQFMLQDIHTINGLDLPTQTMNIDQINKTYPYLNGLPIKSYTNERPKILIGMNNWKLAIPLKVREGTRNQPIASKTRLGWCLQGCTSRDNAPSFCNIHSCDCEKKYQALHEQMKAYFSIESSPGKLIMSTEDQRALEIMENTCVMKNGHYEIGLLWKNDDPQLPDSYGAALHRLNCLEKKLAKDKQMRAIMQGEINKLIAKGYAVKLSEREIKQSSKLIWYLPIFVTLNPNKPGKIRLVWDAASKSNGKSLNEFLITGPDMLRPLFDVLIDFRTGKVAICGDISEMFHRINVNEKDMHAQRFLWYDDIKNKKIPTAYVMRALTFGTSCAPCIAHFIRNKNADTFSTKYPRAVESIKFNHYVDDFIDSADTYEEALKLATDVKSIHAAAGFHMHNWSSNCAVLQKQMSKNITNHQPSHNLGSVEKILGMYWDPVTDDFKYICKFSKLKRDIFNGENVPTKREVLQVLMTIFDPLGLLSLYTISLKILLQDIWRSQISWDDQLPTNLYCQWQQWTLNIQNISEVSIPRNYSPFVSTASDIELHTFVDAGEYAYAAVCYIRVLNNFNTDVSIIAAKNKVSPLKPLSIPRLELQAAVVGVRLASKIMNSRRIKFSRCYWWTDSKTVLHWLSKDPRNFRPFVMHRVGEILETTNTSQWNWISSKSNPADVATKNSKVNSQQWFNGPQFLSESTDNWPMVSNFNHAKENVKEIYEETCELRHAVFQIQAMKYLEPNVKYFSCWRRLYRALATFILYTNRLKCIAMKQKPPTNVSYDIIQKSKNVLYKVAQHAEYAEDIANVIKNKDLSKKSKIKQLNAYLDQEGILKTEGRLQTLTCNRVIILPNNHYITYLIVRYYHKLNHHIFHETVINNIRSKYYIPRLRVLYKKVRKECQWCKNSSSSPVVPQMAPLPYARLACFERPFTFVGIDFFGPYSVIVGRRKEKRWGVVFTCLTVRAIHLEVAYSLDTSSCIMCISNFINRRGTPKEIFTDNGTNFKSTAKVIIAEQRNLNLNGLCTAFEEIKWTFNPPAAPHMGGAWERMVKSIKTVLNAAYPNFKFNDESFQSALCEAEFIINSRPLTFVSLETKDDEPLTPNHLLLGSSSGYKSICSDHNLRDRWRQTQKFADIFWKRWVKEYTPDLLRRGKWFTKQNPASVGDVVILVDENLPRNTWPKGIITETTMAKDGQVRRVKVKTSTNILERPISKVAILDVDKN